jgi:hypothetical protein
VISVSDLTLLPAGEERLLEAERRGESGFGRALPFREICAHEGVTVRVHFVGPVRDGGRDERFAYYDIKVCF